MADSAESEPIPTLGAGINLADPNGPLAPYYASNAGIILALLLTLAGVIYAYQPLWNTDIWGHVAYGRAIAEHGIPKTEPLSPYTDKEQTFGPYSWLAQRGYYACVQIGQRLYPNHELHAIQAGAELIRFVHWLAQLGTFAFLWWACRRRSGSMTAANVALVLLFATIPTMLGIQRPQAFGALFFAIMIWQWSAPPRSWMSGAFMVLLFAVWANIHGSFAVALVFQGLHLLGHSIEAYRVQRSIRAIVHSREFRYRAILLGACFVATFANPHGPLLYRDMMALGSHPNVLGMVEWQTLELRQTGAWVASLASVAVLLACKFVTRRLHATDIVLFLVFVVWGFTQQRMLVWWFLLFPWLASAYFGDLARSLGFKPATAPPELNFRKTFIAFGMAIVGFMFTPWVDLAQNRLRRAPELTFAEGTCWQLALELNALGEQRGQYLPALADELRRHYPNGRYTGPIFATETQGDFLLFTQPEDRPTTMFSHAHAFPVPYWRRCLEVKAGDPRWKTTLREWKVNLIVAEPMFNSGLTNVLRTDPEWHIILDEEGNTKIRDERGRKVIALRKEPLLP